MNINLRCKTLLEIFDKIYKENTDLRNNINKSIEEIYGSNGVSCFLFMLLFSLKLVQQQLRLDF